MFCEYIDSSHVLLYHVIANGAEPRGIIPGWNNAENSISPAILVCIGVAVGMVVMKVIGANRKK